MNNDKALNSYFNWLKIKDMSPKLRIELHSLIKDLDAVNDRFGTNKIFNVPFFSGIIGVGTSRINEYTICPAILGFGKYIKNKENNNILITNGSKHFPLELLNTIARILVAVGNKVFIMNDVPSDIIAGSSIRKMKFGGGIHISENITDGRQGIKFLEEDGGSIFLKQSLDEIAKEKITIEKSFSFIKCLDTFEQFKEHDRIFNLNNKGIDIYLDELCGFIRGLQININDENILKIIIENEKKNEREVIRKALKRAGYGKVLVASIDDLVMNEEDVLANDMIKTIINLDVALASDLFFIISPNLEKMDLLIRENEHKISLLNHKEIGLLMMEYILSQNIFERSEDSICLVPKRYIEIANLIGKRHNIMIETFDDIDYAEAENKSMEFVNSCNTKKILYGFDGEGRYSFSDNFGKSDIIKAVLIISQIIKECKKRNRLISEEIDNIKSLYGEPIWEISN